MVKPLSSHGQLPGFPSQRRATRTGSSAAARAVPPLCGASAEVGEVGPAAGASAVLAWVQAGSGIEVRAGQIVFRHDRRAASARLTVVAALDGAESAAVLAGRGDGIAAAIDLVPAAAVHLLPDRE